MILFKDYCTWISLLVKVIHYKWKNCEDLSSFNVVWIIKIWFYFLSRCPALWFRQFLELLEFSWSIATSFSIWFFLSEAHLLIFLQISQKEFHHIHIALLREGNFTINLSDVKKIGGNMFFFNFAVKKISSKKQKRW